MATKNLCAKSRPVEQPYEVWRDSQGWEWRVLKKYQVNDLKPYARAFCAVFSPITREQMAGGYELGDVYLSDIHRYGHLVSTDYPVVVS
jgi:hypothetical protein